MSSITISGSIMITPDKTMIKSPEFPEIIFDIKPKPGSKTFEIRAGFVNDDDIYFTLDAIDLPPAVIIHAERMRVERDW